MPYSLVAAPTVRTLPRLAFATGLLCCALAASHAAAAPFTAIRIGDIDGFGYTTDLPGLNAANGGDADTNHNGVLERSEYLPDLNGDRVVSVTFDLHSIQPAVPVNTFIGFDDFDNRSAGDQAGANVGGGGFTDAGTTGSQFTDISLSQSFGLAGVYRSPGNPGGFPFPDGTPQVLPNQPGFKFRFTVATGDIDPSQQVFFNLLFADYDVVPATIRITKNNGSGGAGDTATLPLTVQSATDDALIQGAFATLAFDDVFSATAGGWEGYLDVDVLAPNEPYLAYDYVELSTRPIPTTVDAPASLASGALALAGLLLRRRRAR